jgi:hypothetical protein
MTYEGKRDIETGRILADRVEFSKNDFEKGEARLWKDLKVKVKPYPLRYSSNCRSRKEKWSKSR